MQEKKTAGERSVELFRAWQASMTDDDYRQIVFRGSLNRAEIAKGCGIAKSALRQNPQVKALLVHLENDLRNRGILPEHITEEHGKVQKYDQGAARRDMNSARLQRLEQRVIELEAENKELRASISRYSELSAVLSELGRLPE